MEGEDSSFEEVSVYIDSELHWEVCIAASTMAPLKRPGFSFLSCVLCLDELSIIHSNLESINTPVALQSEEARSLIRQHSSLV